MMNELTPGKANRALLEIADPEGRRPGTPSAFQTNNDNQVAARGLTPSTASFCQERSTISG